MRHIYPLIFGFVSAIVVSMLLARVHLFADAGSDTAKAVESPILAHLRVPPEVRTILVAKCADCHSNETRVPFYGRFAPVSWLLERDVVEGRKAMNLSLWDNYSPAEQQTFAAKVVQETKAQRMPLLQYRLIHRTAIINNADIQTLTQWTHTMDDGGTASMTPLTGEGDPVHGKEVFQKRCTGCHSMTEDREGPRLQRIFGRVSGNVAGFAYSDTLKKAHIVWDRVSLERWLTDPDSLVPGNNMSFPVSNSRDRLDLIGYLQQISST
jgi:cytochrome c